MSTSRRLRIALGLLFTATFLMWLCIGREIHRGAPPLSGRVAITSGQVLITHTGFETGALVVFWLMLDVWIASKTAATERTRGGVLPKYAMLARKRE